LITPFSSSHQFFRRYFLFGLEVALALRHDPARVALEDVELLRDLGDVRHELGRGRAGADDAHPLAGEVVLVLPARRVELRAREVVEAGPVGVAGRVEEPDRADEHVADELLAGVEPHRPLVGALVPHGLVDRGVEAQVPPEVVVVEDLLQVRLELGLAGVGAGPVVVLEGVGVEVRLHVDLDARVPVVPPGAADAG
jgi:hypothetical protein